jgi:DNA-binding transcriptional regulator YiaG
MLDSFQEEKIMKNKKTETFIYEAFGFPIKLINVPMKKMIGEWVMDIDFNRLQLAILRCLLYKPVPLSGPELRFLRKFLNMSTTDFGKIFGVTHVAVVKWENGKTHAPTSTDIYIRLYVLNHQQVKDKEFRNLYNTISPETLSKHKGEKIRPISIDIEEDLKIA